MTSNKLLTLNVQLALRNLDEIVNKLDADERKSFFSEIENSYNQLVNESFQHYGSGFLPKQSITRVCDKCGK